MHPLSTSVSGACCWLSPGDAGQGCLGGDQVPVGGVRADGHGRGDLGHRQVGVQGQHQRLALSGGQRGDGRHQRGRAARGWRAGGRLASGRPEPDGWAGSRPRPGQHCPAQVSQRRAAIPDLPPRGMQSDEDVAEVVGRLQKSGFNDAHIMRNYSTNRRVSVGMFSTRERAEKRAAAVRNMGLQPEIGERRFPGTVYWVDVTLNRGPGIKQLLPDYLFADIGHAKVAMQPCPRRLLEPGAPLHAPDDEDGVVWGLPRTTVASAPKVP